MPANPFLVAFEHCATDVVHALPNNIDSARANTVIEDLLHEVHTSHTKLYAIVKIICDWAIADEERGPSAICLFHALLVATPETIFDNSIEDRRTGGYVCGSALCRKYLLNYCQWNFEMLLDSTAWTAGLLRLLAGFATTGLTTLRINIYIIERLSTSEHIFCGHNLERFVAFVSDAGPSLDRNEIRKRELTQDLGALMVRAANQPLAKRVYVDGLILFRENGWRLAAADTGRGGVTSQ